jgi:hypothetical protein
VWTNHLRKNVKNLSQNISSSVNGETGVVVFCSEKMQIFQSALVAFLTPEALW